MPKDNTQRFSNRVEDYVKYRPGYPVEITGYLQQYCGLDKHKIIADIGSGTGISSALFLDAGYLVYAVEPNKEMREKSVELLRSFSRFKAINGTAENTTLPYKSIDFIIAGQAFHWFDVHKAKSEFKKILKKDGIVVLIWNERLIDSAFEKEYDQLIIKHGKDYVQVDHRNISTERMENFFSPEVFQLKLFPNKQTLGFEGLKGRLQSSSYMPSAGEEGLEDMINDLKKLFDRYKKNDLIRINYLTKVYTGKL